jgi:hypothetical protein
VSTEMGPASPTSLGAALSRLALQQARDPSIQVSVVIPYYQFIKDFYRGQVSFLVELAVNVPSPSPGLAGPKDSFVRSRIHRIKWPAQETSETNPNPPTFHHSHAPLTVYLIGAGGDGVYRSTFNASDAKSIYLPDYDSKPVPEGWRELWYAKATTEFLSYLSATSEATLFDFGRDPTLSPEKPDLIQIHGAQSAWASVFLSTYSRQGIVEGQPPIVFTLPGKKESELAYTLPAKTVRQFVTEEEWESFIKDSVVGDRISGAVVGIRAADAVTYSGGDRSSLPESFYLKEVVWSSLVSRAERDELDFIPHALAPLFDPFEDAQLVDAGLQFPSLDSRTRPGGRTLGGTKRAAKQYLVDRLPELFSSRDVDQPLVLVVGHDGPVPEFLRAAVAHKPRARFVVLPMPSHVPVDSVVAIADENPDTVTVLRFKRKPPPLPAASSAPGHGDAAALTTEQREGTVASQDENDEAEWLDEDLEVFVRAAADYVWPPDEAEQGLVFGAKMLDVEPDGHLLTTTGGYRVRGGGDSAAEQQRDAATTPHTYVLGDWSTWGSFVSGGSGGGTALKQALADLRELDEQEVRQRMREAVRRAKRWTSPGGTLDSVRSNLPILSFVCITLTVFVCGCNSILSFMPARSRRRRSALRLRRSPPRYLRLLDYSKSLTALLPQRGRRGLSWLAIVG